MILHANWKHCQRHNGPRNWLRNTDWTLNSQPPLPVEREGMEGFDESQISIEQLWINQLVPRPNRPRCNNFCFHPIHRRNTKLSNHFHSAQGKVASLDNHSHTKLWSPINSTPPITITDAIATFFLAPPSGALVVSRDQRVPGTRPEPEIFFNTRSVPDLFSKSSGISGIGY